MTRKKSQVSKKKKSADRSPSNGRGGRKTLGKKVAKALSDVAVRAKGKASQETPGKAPQPRPQRAAARDTSSAPSAEEQVERSKFDVGVPTRDLSAKVP